MLLVCHKLVASPMQNALASTRAGARSAVGKVRVYSTTSH